LALKRVYSLDSTAHTTTAHQAVTYHLCNPSIVERISCAWMRRRQHLEETLIRVLEHATRFLNHELGQSRWRWTALGTNRATAASALCCCTQIFGRSVSVHTECTQVSVGHLPSRIQYILALFNFGRAGVVSAVLCGYWACTRTTDWQMARAVLVAMRSLADSITLAEDLGHQSLACVYFRNGN
jgi:hypothetical protein